MLFKQNGLKINYKLIMLHGRKKEEGRYHSWKKPSHMLAQTPGVSKVVATKLRCIFHPVGTNHCKS